MANSQQPYVTAQDLIRGGSKAAGFVSSAIGLGLLNEARANVQHAFDRMFFYNTADLVEKVLKFFHVPLGQSYNILGSATATRTKTAEDTNWDQNNQAQYSYLFAAMQLKFQNLEQQSFTASPNDLTTWPDLVKCILEDSSVEIKMEDNIIMRQKAVHIPEGNSVGGAIALTGTNATPASQAMVGNGFNSVANTFSFGNEMLWVPKGSRFNVSFTFGQSALAAAMAYKPATSAAPKLFLEMRFPGVKFQGAF